MKSKHFIFASLFGFIMSCGGGTSDSQENIILDSEEQETQITIVEIDETTTTSTTSTLAPCIKEDNKDLDFTNLKTVQIFLNRYGFNAGDEDGLLGSKTINAIKNFQSFAGLKPDGSVGPKTINAMNNWTGCEKRSSEYVEIQEETNYNIYYNNIYYNNIYYNNNNCNRSI